MTVRRSLISINRVGVAASIGSLPLVSGGMGRTSFICRGGRLPTFSVRANYSAAREGIDGVISDGRSRNRAGCSGI